jgi:hypothetical protein
MMGALRKRNGLRLTESYRSSYSGGQVSDHDYRIALVVAQKTIKALSVEVGALTTEIERAGLLDG